MTDKQSIRDDLTRARRMGMEENSDNLRLVEINTELRADRDRLHKAITEALAFEAVLPAIATEPRRILRAALDKEGNDDDQRNIR